MRRKCGKQHQPNVGGRGVVCYQSARIFLEVVRWQPAILGANKMFEVKPGGTRQKMKFTLLGRRESFDDMWVWPTDARSNIRGNDPAHKKGRGGEQSLRIEGQH